MGERWTTHDRRVRIADVIERLLLKNFGCVREASVALTPIHAFIGPNDSGKSTLLRAVEGLARFTGGGVMPWQASSLLSTSASPCLVAESSGGFAGVLRRGAALVEVAGPGAWHAEPGGEG